MLCYIRDLRVDGFRVNIVIFFMFIFYVISTGQIYNAAYCSDVETRELKKWLPCKKINTQPSAKHSPKTDSLLVVKINRCNKTIK